DSLDESLFIPQHLSNTVWAYATTGIIHPKLFDKVANHIIGPKTCINSNRNIFPLHCGHMQNLVFIILNCSRRWLIIELNLTSWINSNQNSSKIQYGRSQRLVFNIHNYLKNWQITLLDLTAWIDSRIHEHSPKHCGHLPRWHSSSQNIRED
ncbi:hypothetical protein ACHAXM_001013, partial [Skeletonema potamos]